MTFPAPRNLAEAQDNLNRNRFMYASIHEISTFELCQY